MKQAAPGIDTAGSSAGPERRPWLRLYDPGAPPQIQCEYPSALAMFRGALGRSPNCQLLRYFDTPMTVVEVDGFSDALACALIARGVGGGDRVAAYLQNVPQFVLTMLATWKLGGTMVSASPMLKHRELDAILRDSGARVLVTLESLWESVGSEVVPATQVKTVVATSELDFLETVPALLRGSRRLRPRGVADFVELVEEYAGREPPRVEPGPSDVALLTYTSGTTGPSKGAMNTHANVVFNSTTYREWLGLGSDDVVLGMAPLFHVTGLVAHIGVSMLLPAPLVLGFRFDPATMVDLIATHRATFAIGPITAFISLLNEASATPERLESLIKVYSGGSPIPPAVAEAWEERFGSIMHNAYGMTEITSQSHLTPHHSHSPVDPESGALSVGVPVFNTDVRVRDAEGRDLPAGERGEVVLRGPGVAAGYWERPAETAETFGDGWLRTGDVGFMDESGWFFVVDRLKDLVNVSGYKVWPRDVEDVIYLHPAVREAAAVGIPDPYRGETLKAFISLKPGCDLDPDDLIAFCRERMAAYKYPRQVEVIDELPKTSSGKVLRRKLRDRAAESARGK